MSLDIEQPDQLVAYLRDTGRVTVGERLRVSVLAGGVSNRTVLVELPVAGDAWVLKQALAKLRVKVDWFSDPARVQREAEGLRWLDKLAPAGAITPLVFEDRSENLLAMKAVPQPHVNFKSWLLACEWRREEMLSHVVEFGRMLGVIHRHAWERRDEVGPAFADRSFYESLRVEPYYTYTAAREPRATSFLDALIADVRRRRLTLVHGDYSPKNVLIHNARLVLLDHEVIHWGDPAFDVGFGLTHLLSKAHHLIGNRDDLRGAAARYVEAYLNEVSRCDFSAGLESHIIRHALGCLLARVAGRSPLEYLGDVERGRQREVAVAMMTAPPNSVGELVDQFVDEVSRR